MPAPTSNGSFWKTIPGMLTAAAGFITAATGLVVALNQTGLFDARKPPATEAKPPTTEATPAGTEATPAGTEAAAVSGAWKANVTYSWGATYAERFELQVDRDRLIGVVTYLRAPRGIESGVVAGDRITFTVRAEEVIGSETRPYQLTYKGTMAGGGIHFVLEDSRGTPPVQFAAARDLPPQ
jgi:hypothetical protein